MPTGFDVWTRVVLPISTFVLGVVSSVVTQRYLKRRDEIKESARALADLSSDWYNQLDRIRLELNGADRAKVSELVKAYEMSRSILPKAVYHLEVLKSHDRDQQFIREVERFLDFVTV